MSAEARDIYLKNYYLVNKNKINMRHKIYRLAHKKEKDIRQKAYYIANKDKILVRQKVYNLAKKEEKRFMMKFIVWPTQTK